MSMSMQSFGFSVIESEPGSHDQVDGGIGCRFRCCKSSTSTTESFRTARVQITPAKGFSRNTTAAQKNQSEIVDRLERYGLDAKSGDPHFTKHSCSDLVRPLFVDRLVYHGQGRGCDVQDDGFTARSVGNGDLNREVPKAGWALPFVLGLGLSAERMTWGWTILRSSGTAGIVHFMYGCSRRFCPLWFVNFSGYMLSSICLSMFGIWTCWLFAHV